MSTNFFLSHQLPDVLSKIKKKKIQVYTEQKKKKGREQKKK